MKKIYSFIFVFIVIVLAFIAGLKSKNSPVYTLLETQRAFNYIASEVEPSVVNISAQKVMSNYFLPYNYYNQFRGTPFEDFFKDFNPYGNYKQTSLGSGIIISSDGYILTNAHVVESANNIAIMLYNGKIFKNTHIVSINKSLDLALIKVDSNYKFKAAKLGNSDKIKIGDLAIAFGNPFGLSSTMTVGIISGKGRSLSTYQGISYSNLIQTDAPINPGNSGGALVNIKGEVIGVNTAIITPNGGSVGIGFSIPINIAKSFIKSVRSGTSNYHKTIYNGGRSYLGVSIVDYNFNGQNVCLVKEVIPDSPAQKAGIKSGDIILSYNAIKIYSANQLAMLVANTYPGTRIKIQILRAGKKFFVYAKIGRK